MQRPLILLDVDGVLNAQPLDNHLTPPGFQRHALCNGVLLDQRLTDWMLDLSQVAELAWATAWEHEANQLLAPLLGLKQLRVVPMVDLSYPADGGHWKRNAVEGFLAAEPERPVAWVDDEFNQADHAWAQRQQVYLLACDPETGITQAQIKELLDWARTS